MRNRLVVIVCLLGLLLSAPESRAQGVEWVRSMGSPSSDFGNDVAADADGNALVVGQFYETVDFGSYSLTSAGGRDSFIAKLDREGNFIWAKRFGGAGADTFKKIALDGSGHVYVMGAFEGTVEYGSFSLSSAGVTDLVVAKLDSSGTVLWATRLGSAPGEVGFGMAVAGDGSTYVTGRFLGTTQFGSYDLTSAGGNEIFVTKLDSAGTVQWAMRMGGTSLDTGYGIAADADGNAYVTGRFSGTADFGTFHLTSTSGFDSFAARLNSSGTVQWAMRMGGGTGHEIVVDENSNSYVLGTFSDTADFGSYSLTALGLQVDIYVAKLDGDGTVVSAIRLGGESTDYGWDIALDGQGNAFVTGEFHYTGVFGPYSLSSAGGSDSFVAKLDSDGTVQWAMRAGGISTDSSKSIAVDSAENAFVTGHFYGPASFGPYNLTSAGGYDIFVLKLLECGSFVDRSSYGRLLFRPLCTKDASAGTPDVYDSMTIGVQVRSNDAFYLSSEGMGFAPLIADDAIHCDGQNIGLGPYAPQPGIPPFMLDVPIESNLVPLPAHPIPPECVAEGGNELLFELRNTQGEILGNTAAYLVRDCGIYLTQSGHTTLNWVSHGVEIEGFTSSLDVVSGNLAELRADQDFSRSCFLGGFVDTIQAVDARPAPPPGQGYYYLVDGTCAEPIGYGTSSSDPDPRSTLPPSSSCP